MSDTRPAHGPAQRAGRAGGRAPGAGTQPGGQGARPGLAGVREAGPGRGPSCSPATSGSPRRSTGPRTSCSCAARDAGSPCVVIRQGATLAVHRAGVPGGRPGRPGCGWPRRPAGSVTKLPESLGGADRRPESTRAGCGCGWCPTPTNSPRCPGRQPLTFNFGHQPARANATQRPPRQPAAGAAARSRGAADHPVSCEALDWYLEHLGLIVSDFLYYPGQRERGPVMSFIRCDRGATPTDHHTLAMALRTGQPLRALRVPGRRPRCAGRRRGVPARAAATSTSWGIGRHIQGSQIFDYWRDPDGFLVEHYTDGDLFDCTLEPGWAPMTASGLAQWGPPATKDFLGIKPGRQALAELRAIPARCGQDNEFDLRRLRGLLKVASS